MGSHNSFKKPLHEIENSIDFGKYSGSTIRELAEIDPDYVVWLYTEDVIRFSDDCLLELRDLKVI